MAERRPYGRSPMADLVEAQRQWNAEVRDAIAEAEQGDRSRLRLIAEIAGERIMRRSSRG